MKFIIKHDIKGRLRVHLLQHKMTCRQADILLYYLHQCKRITFAKVYERTGDATICYVGNRNAILQYLKQFHYNKVKAPEEALENSGRQLNADVNQHKE